MNLDQFIAKYNGQGKDYDGVYGNQCVDLIKFYLKDMFGLFPGAWGNAVDYFTRPNPAILTRFNVITNRPTDLSQVPSRGDIMVWSGNTPGSGGAGHIAIYDGKVSPGVFRSLDQNWGGMYVHFVNHNYTNVIGWLHPKSVAPPAQGDEMIATKEEAMVIYQMLRPNGGGSSAEISGTVGRRTYKNFLNDARVEMDLRNASLRNQSTQLATISSKLNELNQTVTNITKERNDLAISGTTTKAELNALLIKEQAGLAKISSLTSELETAHDTITDLNKPVDEKTVVTNVLLRFWNSLFNKKG